MFSDTLPKEIFQVIASFLTEKDIATCQTVCSAWYKRWIAYKYYNVHIKGKLQFQAFFHNTLKTSFYPTTHSVGYQIRKLIIENGHIEPSVLAQLPSLCPYLEVFMFDGVTLSEAARSEPFYHYQQQRNREELDKIKHHFKLWTNVRHIVELNGITVTLALLEQPSNLTSITVQFNNQNDRTNSKSKLISSLHNAPFLQSFSVERIYLNVDELEKIHTDCPSLKSLYLTDTVLLPMSTKKQISPTLSLNAFHFINGSFCDGAIMWLDYISKKYINAKILNIGTCSYSIEQPQSSQLMDGTIYESQLTQIAKNCLKLKLFKLQSFILGSHFFNNLDQSGIVLDELTIGDGLTMNLAYELNALLNSHQKHHIKTLTVYGWPLTSDINGLHILMAALFKCPNLTTLRLSLGRYTYQNDIFNTTTPPISDITTVYFDLILKACPKLDTLTITDAKLTVSDFIHMTHASYPLFSLKLENVLIDTSSSFFQILSSNCKQLKHLSLISTIPCPVYHNTRNFNIYLPHHHLETLTLDRVRVSRKCNVRLGASQFKLTSNTGVIWYDLVSYECGNHHRFIHDNSASKKNDGRIYTSDSIVIHTERMRAKKANVLQDADISYSNLDQNVYVSVLCKSIKSLTLSGLCVV